jgi:phage antirepressor YoqD-like protein
VAAMLELKVTLDSLLTFLGLIVNFAGLLYVAQAMRDGNKQRKMDSQIRLYDINRELISLGFSKPELFAVLKDAKGIDPEIEQHYLQLWLNQLSLFHSLKTAGVVDEEYRESVERDLLDMFEMSSMRRHWQAHGKFYPASFQKSVNDLLNKAGHEPTGEKAKRSIPGARFFRKRREAS